MYVQTNSVPHAEYESEQSAKGPACGHQALTEMCTEEVNGFCN